MGGCQQCEGVLLLAHEGQDGELRNKSRASASYGVDGSSKVEFCSEHNKIRGMVDLKKKRCRHRARITRSWMPATTPSSASAYAIHKTLLFQHQVRRASEGFVTNPSPEN